MSWLKLKISGRLVAGFSGLLLLFSITSYLAIINMEKLANRTEMLYKHPFTVSTAVLRIRANVIKLYDLVEYYRLDVKHYDLLTFNKSLANLNQTVEADFNIILERFLGEKGDIEYSFQLYKDWYILLQEEGHLLTEQYTGQAAQLQVKQQTQNAVIEQKLSHFLQQTQEGYHELTQTPTLSPMVHEQYQTLFKLNQAALSIHLYIKKLQQIFLQLQNINNDAEQAELLLQIKTIKQTIRQQLDVLNQTAALQTFNMTELIPSYKKWQKVFDTNLMQLFNSERQLRLQKIEKNNHLLFAQLNERIDHINNFAKNKADLFLNNAIELKQDTLDSMYYLIAFIVVLMTLFAILTIRSIVIPLRQTVAFAEHLRQGQLSTRLENKDNHDETADLLRAMNHMAGSFQHVIDDTRETLDQLAQGKTDIHLQADFIGDFNAIKTALHTTADKLAANHIENEQQAWLKTGQTLLNKHIQGKQNLSDLSKNTLDFLVDYLNCNVGLFYYCHQDENPPYLSIHASFGYPRSQNELQQDKFYKGDGLVGQSLINKRILVREHKTEELHCVPQSGLVWAVPKHVCIIPCCYEGEVNAVIELGNFNGFDATQQAFLEQVMPNIAVAVHTLESHEQLTPLLQEDLNNNDESSHG